MEPGIVQYYEQRNGNPFGIPVVHIGINLQANQDAQTDNFIRQAGFKIVADDVNRTLAGRFQGSGQPIFVVINGVANSPSHKQWQLLVNQNGYGTTLHPIESFRAAIDQVRAPAAAPPLFAPVITTQPQGQSVRVGTSASFSITASGSAPLNYQWQKNAMPLPGAINPILTLANAQPSDAGDYTVIVSNGAGSVTSAAASLVILAPTAAPARLSEFRVLPDRAVAFTLTGEAGRTYRIEVSSNLVDWLTLDSVIAANVTQMFRDAANVNVPSRFYRAVTP